MGRRGGHNRLTFGDEERARFSSALNGERLDCCGVDDQRPMLWTLPCGCVVCKSRHAVRKSKLNHPRAHMHGARDAWELACFRCPVHGPVRCRGQPQASDPARNAHAMLCAIAQVWRPCTVVWEAHVVCGVRAFDFWLREYGVLVEADGWQHGCVSMHGSDPVMQIWYDMRKADAGVAAGFHVVRLHVSDGMVWHETVVRALRAAWEGQRPRVHLTPFYNLCTLASPAPP